MHLVDIASGLTAMLDCHLIFRCWHIGCYSYYQ